MKYETSLEHNSAPKRGTATRRRVLAWAGGLAAAAGLTGFGVHKYIETESKRNSEIDARLGEKIGPAMNALSKQVLDAKAKAKGGFDLREIFDTATGTVEITGSKVSKLGGNKSEFTSLTVVMGVKDGKPNPDDTRNFRLSRQADANTPGVKHHASVELAAPGIRVSAADHREDEGWFAGYLPTYRTDDPTAGYISTDERNVWNGNPDPRPLNVADKAIEMATRHLREVLQIPR